MYNENSLVSFVKEILVKKKMSIAGDGGISFASESLLINHQVGKLFATKPESYIPLQKRNIASSLHREEIMLVGEGLGVFFSFFIFIFCFKVPKNKGRKKLDNI